MTLGRLHFRKPETVPLVFIIIATTVLLTLGFWQAERLQWKEGLIDRAESAKALPAVSSLPSRADEVQALEFRRMELEGRLLTEKPLKLMGNYKGVSGYFVLVPMLLSTRQAVAVNLGFVPQNKEPDLSPYADTISHVQGIFRKPREQRLFSPENDIQRNVWFSEKYEELDKVWRLSETGVWLAPLVLHATGVHEPGVWPVPDSGEIIFRNDHLAYAVTWFTLAFFGLIMFAAYHYIPSRPKDAENNAS